MATQMQLKVLFGRKSHGRPDFYKENNNKVVSFSALFFMFIENKGEQFRRKKNMEIQSGNEKMRNASGQQGENERQWKIKANMNTGNKILGKHIRQFLHKK